MIVAISVACGAGSAACRCHAPRHPDMCRSRRKSVPPMTSVETTTPMMRPICWQRRRAHEVARLQVLRGRARVRGRDADERAHAQGDRLVGLARPADEDEDEAGEDERGDRHPGDRVRGRADEPDDARRDRHEEEAEDDDEERQTRDREGAVRKARQDRDEEREDDRAHDDDPIPRSSSVRTSSRLPSPRAGSSPTRAKAPMIVGSVLTSVMTPGARHRPGADVSDVRAIDPLGMRV